MAGNSLIMMPWFPRDFISATRHLALAERGAYRELLDYQWEMGRLPSDTCRLARLLAVSIQEFEPIWEVIKEKFVETDGFLFNKRLEQHRKRAFEQRERKVNGARVTNAKRYAERDDSDTLSATGSGSLSDTLSGSPPYSLLPTQKEEEAQTKDALAERPAKRPAKRRSTKTAIPDDFVLTQDLEQYVATNLPDASPVDLFADFRRKAEASGWKYVKWPQAFQTYVRNARADSGHFASGQYPRKTAQVRWT